VVEFHGVEDDHRLLIIPDLVTQVFTAKTKIFRKVLIYQGLWTTNDLTVSSESLSALQ
jgi:hypothetical protein